MGLIYNRKFRIFITFMLSFFIIFTYFASVKQSAEAFAITIPFIAIPIVKLLIAAGVTFMSVDSMLYLYQEFTGSNMYSTVTGQISEKLRTELDNIVLEYDLKNFWIDSGGGSGNNKPPDIDPKQALLNLVVGITAAEGDNFDDYYYNLRRFLRLWLNNDIKDVRRLEVIGPINVYDGFYEEYVFNWYDSIKVHNQYFFADLKKPVNPKYSEYSEHKLVAYSSKYDEHVFESTVSMYPLDGDILDEEKGKAKFCIEKDDYFPDLYAWIEFPQGGSEMEYLYLPTIDMNFDDEIDVPENFTEVEYKYIVHPNLMNEDDPVWKNSNTDKTEIFVPVPLEAIEMDPDTEEFIFADEISIDTFKEIMNPYVSKDHDYIVSEPKPDSFPNPDFNPDPGDDPGDSIFDPEPDIPDIPDEGDNPYEGADPEKKIDWEPLRFGLHRKFPFCIPWDIYNAIKTLNISPEIPCWDIDILGNSFTIDFSVFELWAKIIRWGILLIFNIGIIKITRNLIRG